LIWLIDLIDPTPYQIAVYHQILRLSLQAPFNMTSQPTQAVTMTVILSGQANWDERNDLIFYFILFYFIFIIFIISIVLYYVQYCVYSL